ncbi:hypothetical protein [Mycobacterium tuberculosis]|uniref:hypothetical protein n=1 Tax=Mycobacterium tuberculosis TaxID=1773 RepID=UPI00045A6AB6|nr:hypothetical protein [Mycobacterium tuberculosis]KAR73311.1 ESX-1 secretion-associated protein EspK [Mycobacterium tuberculosis TKK_03_0058]KAS78637.1 ESX-1 secretion-associated protein EspK [Mycobacterium tuberculosis TKK_03_0114]KAW52612.1 ESX-1 secretion-associated protein EspK [Mycobacterium tuberculosis TKK_04_0098]KBT47987.1 ESX-1 secretion-associated protein EspK [Mycobacterium tuberculosis TKK_04_0126]KBV51556.1 ESX-1 secretion-associated protein EspK [Mycobacterium tuberculosis TKK
MSITRPTGSYARQMLDPGGWVEADEDTFYDRAQEYSQVLQRVTNVLDTCRQQKGHVFEGGLWSGGAANAANGALGANINQLMTLQDYLATVITWHRHIAGLIEQAKSDIGNNVDGAQREIDILENDPSLDADERHTAINSLVTAVLAVQAWAAFHDMTLRAVIGTAEQLASSDPGVAKIVLEPDDIPESGKMTGRSRLEVVDPSAAAQLADTTDQRLLDLLPPAPVDVNPPGDERHMLWFALMKPMTSTATGREAAHLRAFRAYAAHSQEIALHQAHTATDAAVQRVAVADWLYWQYVTGLLDRALAAAS